MEQVEVNAEVFRIVRGVGERESAKTVRARIDNMLKGLASTDQVDAAIKWLYDKTKQQPV